MRTNSNERRIERAMLEAMTGKGGVPSSGPGHSRGRPTRAGGWIWGNSEDYDRALAIDVAQLTAFLEKTQVTLESEPEELDLRAGSPGRQSFLTLLQGEITKRGVIDVLRRGVHDGQRHRDLFYGMRASANSESGRRFTQNRFSLIPRLQYSPDETQPAVGVCLFVNGLPVATFELKDGLTKQSADDAIQLYKRIDPLREVLFRPGRCMAHFAVDEQQALVCSELRGDSSVFRTFNQGPSDSEANPPNLFGIATDYLWRLVFTRPGLIDIIENYAHMAATVDERTGESRKAPIFPRCHQLEVVRQLLADVEEHNVGRRYLIQHADETGTAYTIAWLISQLSRAEQDSVRIFDSIILVTDRQSSDSRLADTIRNFSRISARVGAESGAATRIHEHIENGVNIILASVECFPLILAEIDAHQRGRRFAFILDEGASDRSEAAPPGASAASSTVEDRINHAMTERARLPNTSTFVFVPTANDTTLELFGQPFNERGTTKYRPFHSHAA